jgi:hypothetical protein
LAEIDPDTKIRTIFANNQEILKGKKTLILSDDAEAGDGTITVESILGAAVNLVLFIGEPGDETSEIVKTHAATSPSGSTVTLASNLLHDHQQGTAIYIIDWDQVEFSYAADDDGSDVVLSTTAIQADQIDTQYTDTTYSTGYYYIRFKNSITSTFSDYSAPIPWGGYDTDSVGAAIEYALNRNKLQGYTENVTHDFCISEICACLKYMRGKLKKWHNLQEFDYSLGKTAQGVSKFALPSNCWKYSNKSILQFRIGTGAPLTYKSKREYDERKQGSAHTTVKTNALAAATSLVLDNSGDFGDSGSVQVGDQVITFTANAETTGTLSGIPAAGTGSITSGITAGDECWKDLDEGLPEIFTIVDGNILIWPLCSLKNINLNAWLDYWKEAPTVDDDGDTIDSDRFDAVKYWLTWAIRGQIKNDGKRDLADADFKMFEGVLSDAIMMELKTHGQKFPNQPRLNSIQH